MFWFGHSCSPGGFWESNDTIKNGPKTAASVAASRTPTKPGSNKTQQQTNNNKQNKNNKQSSNNNNNAAINKLNSSKSSSQLGNAGGKKKGKEDGEAVSNPNVDFNKWCNSSLQSLVKGGVDSELQN